MSLERYHRKWLEKHPKCKKVPWYLWLYCDRGERIEILRIVVISILTSFVTTVLLLIMQ